MKISTMFHRTLRAVRSAARAVVTFVSNTARSVRSRYLQWRADRAAPRGDAARDMYNTAPYAADATPEMLASGEIVELRFVDLVDLGAAKPMQAGWPPLGIEAGTGMPACDACGDTSCTLRVKSDDTEVLCGTCFDLACEEDALHLTGVSLKARSVEFGLQVPEMNRLAQLHADVDDPTWLPTRWFRDRLGVDHPRQWSAFFAGDVIAMTSYNFRRKGWMVEGCAPQRSVEAAMRLAIDLYNDTRNAPFNAAAQATVAPTLTPERAAPTGFGTLIPLRSV